MEKNQVLNSLSVQAREYFDSGAQSFYLRSYPRDVLIPAQDQIHYFDYKEIKNLISPAKRSERICRGTGCDSRF